MPSFILPIAVLLLILAVAGVALRRWHPAGARTPDVAAPAKGAGSSVRLADITPPAAPESIPAARDASEHANDPPRPEAAPQSDLPSPPASEDRPGTGQAGGVSDDPPAAPEPPPPAPPPEPPRWPLFTVKGIASGAEQIVILDTGEMLAAGDRSRTGVRVIRVSPSQAWFVWQGATNSLRKGEASDRPPRE